MKRQRVSTRPDDDTDDTWCRNFTCRDVKFYVAEFVCPCVALGWFIFVGYLSILMIMSGFYNTFEDKLINGDISFAGIDFKCDTIVQTQSGFECQYAFVRFSSNILTYFDTSVIDTSTNNYNYNYNHDNQSKNDNDHIPDHFDEWLLIEWNDNWYQRAIHSNVSQLFCFSTLKTHTIKQISDIVMKRTVFDTIISSFPKTLCKQRYKYTPPIEKQQNCPVKHFHLMRLTWCLALFTFLLLDASNVNSLLSIEYIASGAKTRTAQIQTYANIPTI